MANVNNCPTPGPEMAFNSHRWDIEGKVATCRYCGLVEMPEKDKEVMAPVRTWESYTAGHTFLEDINPDGSLPSD